MPRSVIPLRVPTTRHFEASAGGETHDYRPVKVPSPAEQPNEQRRASRTATLRVGRLDSVWRVRRELARVYKAARRGELDTGDATRLTYCLVSLVKMIEVQDIEKRLRALEGEASPRARR